MLTSPRADCAIAHNQITHNMARAFSLTFQPSIVGGTTEPHRSATAGQIWGITIKRDPPLHAHFIIWSKIDIEP